MDGTDNQPTSGETGEGDRSAAPRPARDKPVSFDFKLRLGSREETSAQLSGRATGELVQLQPIDWDSLVAPPADEPRAYQPAGDLQSIIVELANQIAGPETDSNPVVHVTASATIEATRATSPAAPAAPAAPVSSAAPAVPEAPTVSATPTVAANDPVAPVTAERSPATGRPLTGESEPAPAPKLAPLPMRNVSAQQPQVSPVDPSPRPALADVPDAPDASDASLAAAAAAAVAAAAAARPPAPSPVAEPAVAAAPSVENATGSAAAPTVAQTAEPAFVVADTAPAAVDAHQTVVEHPEPALVVVEPAVAHLVSQAANAPDPVVAPAPVATSAPTAPTAPAAPVVAPAAAPVVPAAPVIKLVSAEASMAATAAPAPSEAVPAPAAPPLSLARIERKANAERPTKPVDFHALLGQAGLQAPAVKRRKKRHPFRALFKLVVLLGIVGAGLYFGKIYVLDKRWDAELKPFAEAVSSERELEWKRAVKVEVLPAEDYATKLATSWLGITEIELDTAAAEWRAMGLAEGGVRAGSIGTAAMSVRPVFYDPIDAKVYELEDLPDGLRELAMDRALTMALLDQHYSWSAGLSELDPAQRIAVRALFDGDAMSTALAIVDPSEADNAELVADYTELQTEYAEDAVGAPRYAVDLVGAATPASKMFDAADGVSDRDELLQTTLRTDAGLFDTARDLDVRPTDLGGDNTETRGLLYWYYVLAGRSTSAEAWDAAIGWAGDRVEVTTTDVGVCVDATVATTGEEARVRLLDALQRWAAAGPSEAGATVTDVGNGQISVHSCDSGSERDTVLNDQVEPFGESIVELTVLQDLAPADAEKRTCLLNAIRGYNVPAVIATGDQAQIVPLLDGLRSGCGLV